MNDLDTLLSGRVPASFGHREHLAVAALALDRFGRDDAELVLRGAIRSAARRAWLRQGPRGWVEPDLVPIPFDREER